MMIFDSPQYVAKAALTNPVQTGLALAAIAFVSYLAQRTFYRLWLHPLSKFPGPVTAASTELWKAYIECYREQSFCDVKAELHAKHGEVIRVGPNELHFSNPQAYHDIYNNKNRWDKDWRLYHSFGEDRSSFGFITYKESKERKDALNKMFSPKAMTQIQGLVVEKIESLCNALKRCSEAGKPADLFWAFRCMTMDIITYLSFGSSVNAIEAPEFHAPIIEAMDEAIGTLLMFIHFKFYKNMIMNCPPNLSKILSPATRGLVDMQQMIKAQINELVQNPEKLEHLPHNMTIYHQLMNKEAYRTGNVPPQDSLYDETQALMFAGADTTGNALMVGAFHLLKEPKVFAKFKEEIWSVWPNLDGDAPSLQTLENLPYLTGVIKESLRLSVGVVTGLPRIVPPEGAVIAGVSVPPGTIVSCGPTFLHFNDKIFPSPQEFRPERWIGNPDLDNWLVSFSRGPRMCLGINLAWMELRLTFPHIFRRLEMKLADGSPESLEIRECFLPSFLGPHVRAEVDIVKQ